MQLISTGGIITAIRRIMERCQPRSREIMLGKKKRLKQTRTGSWYTPYMEMGVHGIYGNALHNPKCILQQHRLFHFQPSSTILKCHKCPEQALILAYLILPNLIFTHYHVLYFNFIFHIDINNFFFISKQRTLNTLKLINSMQIQRYYSRVEPFHSNIYLI